MFWFEGEKKKKEAKIKKTHPGNKKAGTQGSWAGFNGCRIRVEKKRRKTRPQKKVPLRSRKKRGIFTQPKGERPGIVKLEGKTTRVLPEGKPDLRHHWRESTGHQKKERVFRKNPIGGKRKFQLVGRGGGALTREWARGKKNNPWKPAPSGFFEIVLTKFSAKKTEGEKSKRYKKVSRGRTQHFPFLNFKKTEKV